MCGAYMGVATVSIRNGWCEYNGWNIRVNQSLSFESPCQQWKCEELPSVVTITGCSPVHMGPECKPVKGRGEFPYCCMQSVCGKAAYKI
ncbi:hypothetical protein MTO96_041149 [Rhipicephalus appendiculatus]